MYFLPHWILIADSTVVDMSADEDVDVDVDEGIDVSEVGPIDIPSILNCEKEEDDDDDEEECISMDRRNNIFVRICSRLSRVANVELEVEINRNNSFVFCVPVLLHKTPKTSNDLSLRFRDIQSSHMYVGIFWGLV